MQGDSGELIMKNPSENMFLDFDDAQAVSKWQAVDDRIMGGCSQSQPAYIENVGLRFTGTVSLENNGGFASIRSKPDNYDLGQYSGLVLRLRGDGKTYKISLRTDLYFDGVSYQATFNTLKDTWQEISLPFEAFTPTHHGIKLSTVPPINTTSIKSFGLFIADHQEGPFQLDVAWLKGN
jgi:NADH dehydrogenase [ubiquinone] 1 alpha subcomplex assembly factor 1